MSKVIEYRMRQVARPTKEVLGEHLYHKISQVLSQHKFSPDVQLEGRLTGMMLELPAGTVTAMLASEGILRSYICQALEALAQMFPELKSIATAFREQTKLSMTPEDVGFLIYTSVAKLEPNMAAKITGMLLELDTATLWDLLNGEVTSFPAAVAKAKRTLVECSAQQQPSNSFSVSSLRREEEVETGCDGSQANSRHDYSSADILRAELGTKIYNEALAVHPECAANIAGMLLELSISSLTDIVNNKEKLSSAIDKSYQAWHESRS
ncbi:poly-adenylate binding protein, unique domain [Elysia marginata]|uniref:Poly-adenylate binding protein, unique domain n=1 Tax=Elysia marginata TaxID=1093978 RepID=A0AAV4GKC2_9GAST|nr:poly-adenylate binding protein, unique domain [Elysia marginata]